MAVIQKTLFAENLDKYNTFVVDTDPFSKYFKITELADTFTGGKNAFLIQGSNQLVSDTLIKIEIKDSQGNTIYYEPGEGIVSSSVAGEQIVTEYYEGVSKVVAVHVYPDTTFGPCTITILGELSEYYNEAGTLIPVPDNWQGTYNVKWQKQVNVNPKLPNTTKIRFYKRPTATITETLSPIYTIVSGSKVESNIVSSFANVTLSKLDTFAGDVKRIKVYRTSEGDISDYDMIQDILVESKELLTSYELTGSVVGEAGLMTSEVLEKLWNYPTLTTELTSSRLDNGVKLNGSGYFTFTSSLNLSENSVYEFGIDAFYSSSTPSNMGIYVSGSNNGEVLVGTLVGIEPTKNLNDSLFQFTLPLAEPSASLYLSQSQSEWHIGNLSLKLTQDTAFSPSEIGFTTSMPTVIGNETYNFKFEFYDVNNNYVPVEVTSSALFTGGNNNIGGTLIFISSSASQSLAELNAVSSSISGTMIVYSSSADSTIVNLSGSVDTTIVSLSGSVSGSITTLSGSVSGSITTLSGSVSGSINTLSGSVSASITSLSASVSQSIYQGLLGAFTKVQNLADGQYSGSFIGDNVIYSPVLGGQLGYFSTLFKVGQAPNSIYLDARQSPRKIFIGGAIPSGDTEYSGAYNNSNTPVYLDSTGKFSLGDKLSYTAGELSVNGTINVTAGNAATNTNLSSSLSNTITSGSIAASNAATSGSLAAANAALSASNAQLAALTYASSSVNALAAGNWTGGGTTFISSNSIYSPIIQANGGYIAGIFKVGSGGITLDGIDKKIYIGTGTYANINTGFYVDNSGKFSLKDKLTWNGTTLSVQGDIVGSAITGTTISGGSILGTTLVGGSINVPNSTNALFQVNSSGIMTATDANISGQITATSGKLGNWIVDSPQAGGSLKDSTGRIVLNPTDKRISMFNASGNLKAQINADDTLSPIGAGNIYVSSIGSDISAPSGPTSNASSVAAVVGTPTYGTSTSFTIPSSGEYQLSGVFSALQPPPEINLASKVSSLGTVSTSTGNPYGNITPSYPGSSYASSAYGKGISQNVYLVIEDVSSGAEIAQILVSQGNARGAYGITNYYYSTGTGDTDWASYGGYSSAGNYWSYETTPPITSVINFPSSGTYRARYKTVMEASSGYRYYLDGTTYSGVYTYYTVSGINGVAVSYLDSDMVLNKPANFIELSGGGFQAVTNSDQFVKINREDTTGNYSSILLQVEGGQTVLNQDDNTDVVLSATGRTQLYGKIELGGSSYSGEYADPIGANPKLPYLSGLVQNSYTYLSPGTVTTPESLAYPISQGNMHLWMFYSNNTNRYYALPNQLSTNAFEPASSGAGTAASAVNLPVGTTLFLFNKSDGASVYVRGLLPSSTTDGYYELVGGAGIIVVYIGSSAASDPFQDYKWIVYSSFDNTW